MSQSPGANKGKVWAQQEVSLQATDTAKCIYDRLQREMVRLFKAGWHDIRDGRVEPSEQDESQTVYHKKSEIAELDPIDLDASYPGRELINRLRARTFGKRGFAYFEENGERVYVRIDLSKSDRF